VGRSGGPAPAEPRPADGEGDASFWATLPDRLTRFRLGVVPFLWVLAFLRETTWLGAGVAVAALTDVVDGPLARRTGRTSAHGSRLDSIADHTLTASTVAWLVWLRPEFFRAEWPLLAAWGALALLTLAVGWTRFRRPVDLHLYSAKLAGTLGYLFAIWLLLAGRYSRAAFVVVIGVAMLAALETLLVMLTRSAVDAHLRSILWRRRPPGGTA